LYYDEQGNIRYYDNETDNYQQDHYQLHLTHAFSNAFTANLSGITPTAEDIMSNTRPMKGSAAITCPMLKLAMKCSRAATWSGSAGSTIISTGSPIHLIMKN
jgi:hypothetical protein